MRIPCVLLALLLSCGQVLAQTATATQPEIEATAPIEAVLIAGGKTAVVKLVGRAGTRIAYKRDESGAKTKLLDREIVEQSFFRIELKQHELDQIVTKRQWMKAAAILLAATKQTYPYLDLPENNVAELVLNTGDYIMRSAAIDMRAADTPEKEEAAKKKYEAAYAILLKATKAAWSSHGQIARVKSIKCLLEMGKPKTAQHYFEQIEEPFPGDAAYGAYWLVKAEIDVGQKKWRDAMDAAVKSLCFENKDINTFPDALLVSAQCYEEMQEWYRARDVYYEVARLFPKTDWADVAVGRLAFIMDKKLTEGDEDRPIENVFFAFNDDINALTEELLEAYRLGQDVDEYGRFDEVDDGFGTEDLDSPDTEKKKTKDDKGFLD